MTSPREADVAYVLEDIAGVRGVFVVSTPTHDFAVAVEKGGRVLAEVHYALLRVMTHEQVQRVHVFHLDAPPFVRTSRAISLSPMDRAAASARVPPRPPPQPFVPSAGATPAQGPLHVLMVTGNARLEPVVYDALGDHVYCTYTGDPRRAFSLMAGTRFDLILCDAWRWFGDHRLLARLSLAEADAALLLTSPLDADAVRERIGGDLRLLVEPLTTSALRAAIVRRPLPALYRASFAVAAKPPPPSDVTRVLAITEGEDLELFVREAFGERPVAYAREPKAYASMAECLRLDPHFLLCDVWVHGRLPMQLQHRAIVLERPVSVHALRQQLGLAPPSPPPRFVELRILAVTGDPALEPAIRRAFRERPFSYVQVSDHISALVENQRFDPHVILWDACLLEKPDSMLRARVRVITAPFDIAAEALRAWSVLEPELSYSTLQTRVLAITSDPTFEIAIRSAFGASVAYAQHDNVAAAMTRHADFQAHFVFCESHLIKELPWDVRPGAHVIQRPFDFESFKKRLDAPVPTKSAKQILVISDDDAIEPCVAGNTHVVFYIRHISAPSPGNFELDQVICERRLLDALPPKMKAKATIVDRPVDIAALRHHHALPPPPKASPLATAPFTAVLIDLPSDVEHALRRILPIDARHLSRTSALQAPFHVAIVSAKAALARDSVLQLAGDKAIVLAPSRDVHWVRHSLTRDGYPRARVLALPIDDALLAREVFRDHPQLVTRVAIAEQDPFPAKLSRKRVRVLIVDDDITTQILRAAATATEDADIVLATTAMQALDESARADVLVVSASMRSDGGEPIYRSIWRLTPELKARTTLITNTDLALRHAPVSEGQARRIVSRPLTTQVVASILEIYRDR